MALMNNYFHKLIIFMVVPVLSKAYTANWFYKNLDIIGDYAVESFNSKTPAARILRVATNEARIQNNGTKMSNMLNVTNSPRGSTVKKWQVGRVSRKHYEIINMLWRKTNIFVDVDTGSRTEPFQLNKVATHKMRVQRGSTISKIMPQLYMHEPFKISKPSTPSYIEFYYMDEAVENKDRTISERNIETQVENKNKALIDNLDKFKSFSRSPFFAFHVNDPASALKRVSHISRKKTHFSNYLPQNINKTMTKVSSTENFVLPKFVTKSIFSSSLIMKNSSAENVTDFIIKLSVPVKNITTETTGNNIIEKQNVNEAFFQELESTTAYDKIKFFEVYDSDTVKPSNITRKASYTEDNNENTYEENSIDRYQKILLEHVDQGVEHHSSAHKLRYAVNDNIGNTIKSTNTLTERYNTVYKTITEHKFINVTSEASKAKLLKVFKLKRENILNTDLKPNMSRSVNWSEYPFIAVYVYERYQVHCDAAVISPHWLVASGSCLSRHNEKPGGEGRSAFVTYCGDSWWDPERITYVKYSLVHPRYHPQEISRRQLFNIGVINVVSSMDTACSNWEPVSIMSHQYTASSEGDMASAIGWGLDRYDTKYTSTDLPRRPLTLYEGLVFSDSCPGNSGYRKSKIKREEGIKNVYCLALPPYDGEEKDPVHGGLLLVGGKLIALYLQEERRYWGDQSAQYTGIWKLLPWMLNVVREPEEADFQL